MDNIDFSPVSYLTLLWNKRSINGKITDNWGFVHDSDGLAHIAGCLTIIEFVKVGAIQAEHSIEEAPCSTFLVKRRTKDKFSDALLKKYGKVIDDDEDFISIGKAVLSHIEQAKFAESVYAREALIGVLTGGIDEFTGLALLETLLDVEKGVYLELDINETIWAQLPIKAKRLEGIDAMRLNAQLYTE